MPDGKTGGSRWVPDIRPEEIGTFQEKHGDTTATYKAVNVHPIINRVLDKLAFFRTHAAAVWYNKLAGKTVADKFGEVDEELSALNAKNPRVLTAELPANGSIAISYPYTLFSGILSVQGALATLYATYILNGYANGGSRYHATKISGGNDFEISISEQTFTLKNNASAVSTVSILTLMGAAPTLS